MDLSLSSLILPATALVIAALLSFVFFSSKQSQPQNPIIIKGHPIIGNLLLFVKNEHRLIDWVAELVAASPTCTATVVPIVFTANPSNVEHLTKSRFDNYPKSSTVTACLHDFLGRGIINVDGDSWRSQRKSASFEFNTRSIRSFILDTVSFEVSARLLPFLSAAAASTDTERTIDLQDVLERFAFDNICRLIFDKDPKCLGGGSDDGERFYHAFDEAATLSIFRWRYPFHCMWKLLRFLDVGSEKRLRASMTVVHESVCRWIRSRRASGGSSKSDFLSRLADDAAHSDEFVRDILINFVLAGRDTTPSALTWFFWITSSRPDVLLKIINEIKSIRSNDNHEAFTLDELREMQYLHAAISESMRLYPPVALQARESLKDDVLPDGTEVRKGWTLMYSAYAMGRMEGIWGKDCLEFRPERWLDEVGVFKPTDPFRYPVFHAGPRLCLGKDFAYIQMKAVAASILERFELEVAEERGRYQQLLTLRMAEGLPVRVKERKRDA
nr:cytochrome P450 [Paris polyphylla]